MPGGTVKHWFAFIHYTDVLYYCFLYSFPGRLPSVNMFLYRLLIFLQNFVIMAALTSYHIINFEFAEYQMILPYVCKLICMWADKYWCTLAHSMVWLGDCFLSFSESSLAPIVQFSAMYMYVPSTICPIYACKLSLLLFLIHVFIDQLTLWGWCGKYPASHLHFSMIFSHCFKAGFISKPCC